MKTELQERIDKLIHSQFGFYYNPTDFKELGPIDHLVNDLGADSLDLVELIMLCEDEFGVEISLDVEDSLETVGDLYEIIEREME